VVALDAPHEADMLPVEWRLVAVAERQCVTGPVELAARLADVGAPYSVSHVSRLLTQEPHSVSLLLLGGLCDALECIPGDLLALKRVTTRNRRSVFNESPPPHVSYRTRLR
jgi:DNA-binding Xre family transcriptional regulator